MGQDINPEQPAVSQVTVPPSAFTYWYPQNLGTEEYPHYLRIEVFQRTQGAGATPSLANDPTRVQTGRVQSSVQTLTNINGAGILVDGVSKTAEVMGVPGADTPVARLGATGIIGLGNTLFPGAVYGLKPIGDIFLYINGAPSVSYSSLWKARDLGLTASPAAGAGTALGNALVKNENESSSQYITNLGAGLTSFIQGAQEPVDYLIQEQAAGSESFFGDFQSTLRVQSGTALDPYNANTYKFLPKNVTEATSVKNIIYQLKKNMHGTFQQYKIVYPGEFKLTYYYNDKENTSLFKTKNCALTSINVTYGNDKEEYVSFKDGSPVEINMELNFKELAFISASDITDTTGSY